MKTFYALAVGLALILSASVAGASAAPLDPTIILRDPPCTTVSPCTIETGGSFGLQIESDGGGVFNIQNDSGVTWTSLTFSILAPAGESLFGCVGGTYFQNCNFSHAENLSTSHPNLIEAFFSGLGPCEDGQTCSGVPSGGAITIDLDPHCAGTPCGTWQPNSIANVTPNPEPESFVLLLTGFLPLIPLRKKFFGFRRSA